MEPNSLIFLTLISKLQSRTVAICLSAKYPDDPFLNQNHWIALNARFSLTADPQLTTPPPPLPPKNEIPNSSLSFEEK